MHCICAIFLQMVSNDSSNTLSEQIQSCIFCICAFFLQSESSFDSSNRLSEQMQSRIHCIFAIFFKWFLIINTCWADSKHNLAARFEPFGKADVLENLCNLSIYILSNTCVCFTNCDIKIAFVFSFYSPCGLAACWPTPKGQSSSAWPWTQRCLTKMYDFPMNKEWKTCFYVQALHRSNLLLFKEVLEFTPRIAQIFVHSPTMWIYWINIFIILSRLELTGSCHEETSYLPRAGRSWWSRSFASPCQRRDWTASVQI